jgi:DNA-binding NarL/FixJ family response regulator
VSISVVLADDHDLVRESLSRCLSAQDDIAVVAAVGRAEDAVAAVLEHRPTVAVLDVDMPGLSVFEAVRRVREGSPNTQLLMLSGYWHDRYIEQALQAGAIGYLTKTESLQQIVDAIRSVAAGVPCFSPEVRSRMVNTPADADSAGGTSCRASHLTAREMEVLRHVADGLTNKEIAARLQIALRTVDRHVERVMNRLDIHDRVSLARFAIREGIARP